MLYNEINEWMLLWGKASTSNTVILELFQSKALRMIVNAPWYVPKVPNTAIRRDPQTSTVKEEIRHHSSQYSAHLSTLPDDLWLNIMEQQAITKTPAKWSANQIPSVSYL
jgi:hypothetical protein